MYTALAEILTAANSNTDIRVVVLTGGDVCFSAGNDLADFLNDPPKDIDAPVFRFMASIIDLKKPLIAAVCGPAIVIGTTVLPHCDSVHVTRQSRFALPFVHLGLCPEFGSSHMLPLILGPVRARHLLLTGEVFSGQQALEWGLATFAYESPDECLAAAADQAVKIAKTPYGALALLTSASRYGLQTLIQKEGEVLINLLKTDESRAALSSLAS